MFHKPHSGTEQYWRDSTVLVSYYSLQSPHYDTEAWFVAERDLTENIDTVEEDAESGVSFV